MAARFVQSLRHGCEPAAEVVFRSTVKPEKG
jgi:hypothetical protein